MTNIQTPPANDTHRVEPEWQWFARDRSLAPEQQVRRWLAPRLGCTPDDLPLQRSPHGRPRLCAPHVADDISWSHSGEGLLIAHARNAVVGIDLEFERHRAKAVALAERYFHPDEAAWVAARQGECERQSAFIRLWCAKEAVLKAHGRGLAFGLDRLQFNEVDGVMQVVACDPRLGDAAHWQLRELVPQAGYRAALAWYPGILPA